APAGGAARAAARLLQRAGNWLHDFGACRVGCLILPHRLTAAAVDGDAAVPDAAVVSDVDGAQCRHAGRASGAGARPGDRSAADLVGRRPRPDLDGSCRRNGRLWRAPAARGAAMIAFDGLWPYLILILVGFLPSDFWRLLGIVVARGLDEESEVLIWVRAVATAVLAGVIAKIVFFPPET